MVTVNVTVRFSNHFATSHNYEGTKFQIISELHAFEKKKVLKKITFPNKMQTKMRTVKYYRKAVYAVI